MATWISFGVSVSVLCLLCGKCEVWGAKCPDNLPYSSKLTIRGDYCYQFVYKERYWDEARDFCTQQGGWLVRVNDAETNEFLVSELNSMSWNNNGVWIGLHDRNSEMNWEWVGGNTEPSPPVRWTNWGRGHPKARLHTWRDCIRMVRGSGDWKWHETPCHMMKWHYRFICQYNTVEDPIISTDKGVVNINGVNRKYEDSTSPPLTKEIFSTAPTKEIFGTTRENFVHATFARLQSESLTNDAQHDTRMIIIIICAVSSALILVVMFLLLRRRLRRYKEDVVGVKASEVTKDDSYYKYGKDYSEVKLPRRIYKVPLLKALRPKSEALLVKKPRIQSNVYIEAPSSQEKVPIHHQSLPEVPKESSYVPMSGTLYEKIAEVIPEEFYTAMDKEDDKVEEGEVTEIKYENIDQDGYSRPLDFEINVKKPSEDEPVNLYSEVNESERQGESIYECMEDVVVSKE